MPQAAYKCFSGEKMKKRTALHNFPHQPSPKAALVKLGRCGSVAYKKPSTRVTITLFMRFIIDSPWEQEFVFIIAQVSDLRQSFERRWKILLEWNHETRSPSPAPDKTLLCHSVIAHNYPFIHEIRVATSHTMRAFKIVTVSLKRSVKRTARNDIRSRVEFYSEAICKTYKIMHIIMQFASWTQNLPSSLDSNWKCY